MSPANGRDCETCAVTTGLDLLAPEPEWAIALTV
jgi:hypothetical protein